MMQAQLPIGSTISLVRQDTGQVVVIPNARRGIAHYFPAAFLICWLVAWAVGWVSAFRKIMGGAANTFLLAWLGAWTLGGAYALFVLWRMLRPALPETLTLTSGGLIYDSGVQPLAFSFGTNARAEAWKALFARRTRIDIDRAQLKSLSLRATERGNRLTIDVGVKRLEIATSATEIEREWLYRLLTERYA